MTFSDVAVLVGAVFALPSMAWQVYLILNRRDPGVLTRVLLPLGFATWAVAEFVDSGMTVVFWVWVVVAVIQLLALWTFLGERRARYDEQ